jgi:hypothetical protein
MKKETATEEGRQCTCITYCSPMQSPALPAGETFLQGWTPSASSWLHRAQCLCRKQQRPATEEHPSSATANGDGIWARQVPWPARFPSERGLPCLPMVVAGVHSHAAKSVGSLITMNSEQIYIKEHAHQDKVYSNWAKLSINLSTMLYRNHAALPRFYPLLGHPTFVLGTCPAPATLTLPLLQRLCPFKQLKLPSISANVTI